MFAQARSTRSTCLCGHEPMLLLSCLPVRGVILLAYPCTESHSGGFSLILELQRTFAINTLRRKNKSHVSLNTIFAALSLFCLSKFPGKLMSRRFISNSVTKYTVYFILTTGNFPSCFDFLFFFFY